MSLEKDYKAIIVTANPGWYELIPAYIGSTNEVEGFIREPIIAWEISSEPSIFAERENDIFVCPITKDGALRYGNNILKRPDGSIAADEGTEYANEHDLLKSLNNNDN